MGNAIYTDPGLQAQAKAAWDLAIPMLVTAGMAQGSARRFFGRLLSQNHITAAAIFPAVQQAQRIGTGDPAAYLSKAARGAGAKACDAALSCDWT